MTKNKNSESGLIAEEYIHLVASQFLWIVLNVFDDEVNNQYYDVTHQVDYTVFERYSEWSSLVDNVLEWALREGLKHQSRLNHGAYDYTESLLGDSTNNFMTLAEQRIMGAATPSGRLNWIAENRLPVSVYLYYCGWLFYVLRAYQEIQEVLTITAPQLVERFEPIREEYRKLLETLQDELQSIGTMVGVEERIASQVREDVEAVGQELTEDWRRAVYNTARQLQGAE